jgi:hypothetical protein
LTRDLFRDVNQMVLLRHQLSFWKFYNRITLCGKLPVSLSFFHIFSTGHHRMSWHNIKSNLKRLWESLIKSADPLHSGLSGHNKHLKSIDLRHSRKYIKFEQNLSNLLLCTTEPELSHFSMIRQTMFLTSVAQ